MYTEIQLKETALSVANGEMQDAFKVFQENPTHANFRVLNASLQSFKTAFQKLRAVEFTGDVK